jgi:hypothetical protein
MCSGTWISDDLSGNYEVEEYGDQISMIILDRILSKNFITLVKQAQNW